MVIVRRPMASEVLQKHLQSSGTWLSAK
jgi:hypothetical protein